MTPLLWLLLFGPRPYDGPREVAALAQEAPAEPAEPVAPDVAPVAPTAPTVDEKPVPEPRRGPTSERDEGPVSVEGGAPESAVGDEPVSKRRGGAPQTPRPRSAAKTWVVGAFVDAGYVFNSNLPDNHVNRGNGTSPRTDEFTVPYAATYIRHDANESEPWSVELALQLGPAATALAAPDPQPGGDASRFAGPTVWQHIGRANVGARIPRLGTEIAAGFFGTPISIWSFWSKDNWAYSTPWHLNAVPYVLMGGRILQPIGERVVLHAWVVNGYQTYADVNKVPSYMFGVMAVPIDGLEVAHFDYFGPEDVDPAPRAWRWLSDTWAFYERGRFGLAVIGDVLRERITALPGSPVALYLTTAAVPRFRVIDARGGKFRWFLVARGEAFWDRDGRIYGVRQLLGSASIGSDMRLWEHISIRLEYRYDRSSNRAGFFYRGDAVHDDDPGLGRDQHTAFAMLSGAFEHWFATRRKR